MEWIDTNQQVVYKEKENEWVQMISWKKEQRILHADLVYQYATGEFTILSPFEDQGVFEPVLEENDPLIIQELLRNEAFVCFLGERKSVYEQLLPLLKKSDFEINDVMMKNIGKFAKELVFSLDDHLAFTAYFERQTDWHLDELTLQTQQHTLRRIFQNTAIEKTLESQLRKHLV